MDKERENIIKEGNRRNKDINRRLNEDVDLKKYEREKKDDNVLDIEKI
jgi:hypothetical protein